MRYCNRDGRPWAILRAAAMALAFLGCTGCIMFPLPSDRHKHGSRRAIPEHEIAALVPGETTLTQAVLRLGEPEYMSLDETKINYYWEKVTSELWIFGWWFDDDESFHRYKHGKIHNLDLTFDADGKLLKHDLTHSLFDEAPR